MQDYEKLGVFYLGRLFHEDRGSSGPEPMLLESRELVTHAAILGMTGSGKTGLGVALLEEAAIDGVPALVIDPKGDLGNLLLAFPGLRPEAFVPWVPPDEAARRGLSPEDLARAEAERWRQGLAAWDQPAERVDRLTAAAEFAVYTPGSTAGRPLSVLSSFAAPPPAVLDDPELLSERIGSTVSGLLSLLKIEADPLRSREHILLSALLQAAWAAGRDLALADLIREVQAPPLARVGVLELESFYPAGDRFELAMRLNALLAAPGFEAWAKGEPLDVDRLLRSETGRPRVAIFSLAHLSDAERMFFVTLLLNAALGWMRGQGGTTSLRALLYMDEMFGYLPPVANPPSKKPLLTMLKQARAFGLGLVLATQNPVDLDYKALANMGTWFLGRMQTDRDRARVLEGLREAGAGGDLEASLKALRQRVFLMQSVHQPAPLLFETRWTLSYLRGPLTRDDLRRLQAPPATAPGPGPAVAEAVPAAPAPASGPPVLPPEITQVFLPAGPGAVRYRATLAGVGKVHFEDRKLGVQAEREVVAAVPVGDGPLPVDWKLATVTGLEPSHLRPAPEDLPLGPVPAPLADAGRYAGWSKDFADWLFRTQRLEIRRSPSVGLASAPGEGERDFRIRLVQAAREKRDRDVETLREKYEPKLARLRDKLERARVAAERQESQVGRQKVDAAVSFGSTLVGALFGRKLLSVTNLRQAGSTLKHAGRSAEEERDLERAREKVLQAQEELRALEDRLHAEIAEKEEAADPLTEPLETVAVAPRKTDVSVRLAALGWAPVDGRDAPAWKRGR